MSYEDYGGNFQDYAHYYGYYGNEGGKGRAPRWLLEEDDEAVGYGGRWLGLVIVVDFWAIVASIAAAPIDPTTLADYTSWSDVYNFMYSTLVLESWAWLLSFFFGVVKENQMYLNIYFALASAYAIYGLSDADSTNVSAYPDNLSSAQSSEGLTILINAYITYDQMQRKKEKDEKEEDRLDRLAQWESRGEKGDKEGQGPQGPPPPKDDEPEDDGADYGYGYGYYY